MQYNSSMPRYTIDFDKEFDKTLSDLIETTDATTKADVIRRAVASYSYLKNQQKANKDAKIVITDDDKLRKEIVLP
jgi:metal-responsive CopG/Arc/MetJ family transcriptional regulator